MTGVRSAARRTAVAVTVLAAALLSVAGCAGSDGSAGSAGAPATTASTSPSATATPSASPSTSPRAKATGPRPLPSTKPVDVVGLSIPAIGVKITELEHLKLMANAELSAPKDPDLAGWYADGPVPGTVGPSVIAGHVDSKTGPAVFAKLGNLEAGDKITITLSNGTSAAFTVDKLQRTTKDGFPTEEVYGPTPDAQLRLITCSGPYDRTAGAYVDNTVVFATQIAK